MKNVTLALAVLLLLPGVPLAAQTQDRCVQNSYSDSRIQQELSERREELRFATNPDHISFVTQRIKLLEGIPNWDSKNGVGNGWIADSPNTCILYISSPNEPIMGTRIYFLGTAGVLPVPSAVSGQQAVVAEGPARIRSGPGLEHPRVRWCDQGLPLTVWLPAVDGWLRASCFGANGWIHESLVQLEDGPDRLDIAAVAVSDLPPSASGQQAVVTEGPARIRSGPGLEHPRVRWCDQGLPLTVWLPAVDGWLQASCYGANGWIHESLVQFDDEPAQIDPAPAAVSDVPPSASGQQAVVTEGPARIRSGPGLEHPRVRWCDQGLPLTVWLPAVDGWLRASCFGANGWIHESLVQTGG